MLRDMLKITHVMISSAKIAISSFFFRYLLLLLFFFLIFKYIYLGDLFSCVVRFKYTPGKMKDKAIFCRLNELLLF